MNGNGNGWAKILTAIVAGAGLIFSIVVGAATLSRDTPTRDEMTRANTAQDARMKDDLNEIKATQIRMDKKLDRLIERGEGN